MRIEDAHEHARAGRINRRLYSSLHFCVRLFSRAYFRLDVSGAEYVPEHGAAIIAPNHKSFFDAFFVGVAIRRPLRFMAKAELFRGPSGILGGVFARLGAFPVRRNESDEDALETARVVLAQGDLLVLFPEGTRIRDEAELGRPRRGAARLALEASVPIIPCAIDGTNHLWFGPIPKPRHVRVVFSPPVATEGMAATPEAAMTITEEVVWPEVKRQFEALRRQKRKFALAGLVGASGFAGWLLTRKRRPRK